MTSSTAALNSGKRRLKLSPSIWAGSGRPVTMTSGTTSVNLTSDMTCSSGRAYMNVYIIPGMNTAGCDDSMSRSNSVSSLSRPRRFLDSA